MTRFKYEFTFTWEDTRDEVLDSGLWIEGRASNKAILDALKKWHKELGASGIDDKAVMKMRISISKKEGRSK